MGIGATPHRWANAAGLRSRWGLSPAVEQLSGDVDAETGPGQQRRWCGLADERLELGVELGDVGIEALVAPGDRAEGSLGRLDGGGELARSERSADRDELAQRQAPQLRAQLVGGGRREAVELMGGR